MIVKVHGGKVIKMAEMNSIESINGIKSPFGNNRIGEDKNINLDAFDIYWAKNNGSLENGNTIRDYLFENLITDIRGSSGIQVGETKSSFDEETGEPTGRSFTVAKLPTNEVLKVNGIAPSVPAANSIRSEENPDPDPEAGNVVITADDINYKKIITGEAQVEGDEPPHIDISIADSLSFLEDKVQLTEDEEILTWRNKKDHRALQSHLSLSYTNGILNLWGRRKRREELEQGESLGARWKVGEAKLNLGTHLAYSKVFSCSKVQVENWEENHGWWISPSVNEEEENKAEIGKALKGVLKGFEDGDEELQVLVLGFGDGSVTSASSTKMVVSFSAVLLNDLIQPYNAGDAIDIASEGTNKINVRVRTTSNLFISEKRGETGGNKIVFKVPRVETIEEIPFDAEGFYFVMEVASEEIALKESTLGTGTGETTDPDPDLDTGISDGTDNETDGGGN